MNCIFTQVKRYSVAVRYDNVPKKQTPHFLLYLDIIFSFCFYRIIWAQWNNNFVPHDLKICRKEREENFFSSSISDAVELFFLSCIKKHVYFYLFSFDWLFSCFYVSFFLSCFWIVVIVMMMSGWKVGGEGS